MTARKIPEIIKITARKLRQEMTISEKILWDLIRTKKLNGRKFLRQYPVYLYTENNGLDRFIIPDFICKDEKIIIELDGNIHNLKEIYELDKIKEELLIKLGYKVIRFNNDEVLFNINQVIETIEASFS